MTRPSPRPAPLRAGAPWGALLLASCALSPPPRTLADRLAHEPVWPAVEAPMTSLLDSPDKPVVIPFGDENLRCSLRKTGGPVALDCDGVSHEEPDIDALLRAINGGVIHRNLARHRLASQEDFKRITQIEMASPWQPDAALSGPAKLEEPFGQVTLSVGPRGEISATLTDLQEPASFQAQGLWGLGNQLRAARKQLHADRAAFRITRAMEVLLAPLRLPPDAGYGATALGATSTELPPEERDKQWTSHGVLRPVERLHIKGKVARLDRTLAFHKPHPSPHECASISPWMEQRFKGIRPEKTWKLGCLWVLEGQGVELHIEENGATLSVGYSLSMGRRMELER